MTTIDQKDEERPIQRMFKRMFRNLIHDNVINRAQCTFAALELFVLSQGIESAGSLQLLSIKTPLSNYKID